MTKFNFCPNCGKDSLKSQELKYVCSDCNYVVYMDSVACASVLPIKDGKVLLAIRKNDPLKGTYDLIGGFINPEERAEDAACRETKEETGLDVKITEFFGTYPDKYGNDGAYVLVLVFIVEVTGGIIKPSDDVSELIWVPISDIPNLKLTGFKNVTDVLTTLHKKDINGKN